jgi:hypothetical protein
MNEIMYIIFSKQEIRKHNIHTICFYLIFDQKNHNWIILAFGEKKTQRKGRKFFGFFLQ